jgi:hypothetical protein
MMPGYELNIPSRSDPERLSLDEQAANTAKVEAFFAATTPKRPQKPPRSEGEGSEFIPDVPTDIPELKNLEALRSAGFNLPSGTGASAEEDVDHKYYEAMTADGVHHTTGTGFIQIDKPSVLASVQLPVAAYEKIAAAQHKTNPATNEWDPTPSEYAETSNKPARSESTN